MGMLSDFFAADPEDAAAYEFALMEEDPDALSQYHAKQHKGFTGLEVARLHALLQKQPFSVETHTFEVISTEDHEGLTEAFPEEFTDALASLEPSSIEALSLKWALDMREEATHDPAFLVTVLQDLTVLAQAAKAEGKSVFLWYSI
jgi:hypothetical protein